MKKLLIIATLLLGLNVQAGLVTDRPSQSISAAVMPLGSFVLQSGITANDSEKIVFNNNNQLRIGVMEDLEISGAMDYLNLENGEFDNYKVGMRSLLFGSKYLNIAAQNQLVKADDQGIEVASTVALGTGVGDHSLGANLNYFKLLWSYSVIYSYSVSDSFSLFLEEYAQEVGDDKYHHFVDFGGAYLFFKNLQLDFSAGIDLEGELNERFADVGISIGF